MNNKAEYPSDEWNKFSEWYNKHVMDDEDQIDMRGAAFMAWEAQRALQGAEPVAWIPVSERLPEDGVRVLVATGRVPAIACCYNRGLISGSLVWIADTSNYSLPGDSPESEEAIIDNIDSDEVTHWQPLPAPPTTLSGKP